MTRRHAPALLLLLTATLVGACGTPTPYQSATNGHGYREQPIAENRYRVIVSRNRLTDRSRVEDYLLYRAAELTRDNGADRFTVVTRDVERTTSYWATSSGPHIRHGLHCHTCGHAFGPFIDHAAIHPRNQYRASAEILIHTDQTALDTPGRYRASEVIDRLRGGVQRAAGE